MDYELMMNGNVKIGQKAPDFEAETTFGKVSLDDYKGKWLVLFSHPGDFTPISILFKLFLGRIKNLIFILPILLKLYFRQVLIFYILIHCYH